MINPNNHKNGSARAIAAAKPSQLAMILSSLAVGIAAMSVGALAPHLQPAQADAHQPEITQQDTLFAPEATIEAMSARELQAIESQLAVAESKLERHRRASSGAVSRLAHYAIEG